MTVLGFSLLLVAAFSHAIWNVFVKRINGGPEAGLAVLSRCDCHLPAGRGFHLRNGEARSRLPRDRLHRRQHGSASAYFLLLQRGYRKGDLSLVYPTARASGPFLSTMFAVAVLGETITPQIATGGLIVIIGVLFLTGGFKSGARHMGASLLFGLGAGVVSDSWWKLVFGVAPDHDGCSIRRRGQSAS